MTHNLNFYFSIIVNRSTSTVIGQSDINNMCLRCSYSVKGLSDRNGCERALTAWFERAATLFTLSQLTDHHVVSPQDRQSRCIATQLCIDAHPLLTHRACILFCYSKS